MIVRQYLKPQEKGNGPTMSIWTFANRLYGVENDALGEEVWRVILFRWHLHILSPSSSNLLNTWSFGQVSLKYQPGLTLG
jgi:hypothetical protein